MSSEKRIRGSRSRSPSAKKRKIGHHRSPFSSLSSESSFEGSPSESSSRGSPHHSPSAARGDGSLSGEAGYFIVDPAVLKEEERKEKEELETANPRTEDMIRRKHLSGLPNYLKSNFEKLGHYNIHLDMVEGEKFTLRNDFDIRNPIIGLTTNKRTAGKGFFNWTALKTDEPVYTIFNGVEKFDEKRVYILYKKDTNIPNRNALVGGRVNKSRRRKRHYKNKTTRRK